MKAEVIMQGVMVDLTELKKTSKIILWGRFLKQDLSVSPYMKIMEIAADWNNIPEKKVIVDTHISFE